MDHHKNGRKDARRGFALIISILAAAILVALLVPYVSRVVTEHNLMARVHSSTAALDLAEAGIERGLWEIRYNNGTFSGWNCSVDADGNMTCSTSFDSFQTADGKIIGDYDVTAYIASGGMTPTVTAIGYVPSRALSNVKRTVKVTYSKHNFGKGIIGLNGITMSGQARTDSYDSSLGSYDAQPHTQHGDIASNGPISLSGGAYVNGDANPGPGYPFTGIPPVSGSYGTLEAPMVIDPIPASVMENARNNNNNANIIHDPQKDPLSGYDFSVSNDTVTLPAGTYYFTSMSLTGPSAMIIGGPVIIYVDGGTVNIAGQGIINNGRPRDLLMYSTGPTISLSGQAAMSGAIYAPTATVVLTGQEDYYGSIICGSNLDSGQAEIHYDMDLLNVMPVFANNRVTSWQELYE